VKILLLSLLNPPPLTVYGPPLLSGMVYANLLVTHHFTMLGLTCPHTCRCWDLRSNSLPLKVGMRMSCRSQLCTSTASAWPSMDRSSRCACVLCYL